MRTPYRVRQTVAPQRPADAQTKSPPSRPGGSGATSRAQARNQDRRRLASMVSAAERRQSSAPLPMDRSPAPAAPPDNGLGIATSPGTAPARFARQPVRGPPRDGLRPPCSATSRGRISGLVACVGYGVPAPVCRHRKATWLPRAKVDPKKTIRFWPSSTPFRDILRVHSSFASRRTGCVTVGTLSATAQKRKFATTSHSYCLGGGGSAPI